MKHPLIRPGGGPDELDNRYAAIAEERRKLLRMIDIANADHDEREARRRGLLRTGGRSAAGDEDRLRAIPVCAPGVPGAIPGTAPHLLNL